jgi:hypothetical protein
LNIRNMDRARDRCQETLLNPFADPRQTLTRFLP